MEYGYILINPNQYGLFYQGLHNIAEKKVMKLIGTYCDKYCEKCIWLQIVMRTPKETTW